MLQILMLHHLRDILLRNSSLVSEISDELDYEIEVCSNRLVIFIIVLGGLVEYIDYYYYYFFEQENID